MLDLQKDSVTEGQVIDCLRKSLVGLFFWRRIIMIGCFHWTIGSFDKLSVGISYLLASNVYME